MKQEQYSVDFCVIGGGLAGVCAAVVAARQGLEVALIQDRPVLGGNASSEIRLWALGATSHLGNNNRWAREGGVIDEIMVENLYRNPEGNPVLFDTVILDTVVRETHIRLFLNTAVTEVDMHDRHSVRGVKAYNAQNATWVQITAPLFCDASGDGVVGELAGAVYRMGAESGEEFGEKFAPSQEYGSLMGHSLFFYSKDTDKPVRYVAPDFALKDITQIPRYRNFKKNEKGCELWWIEYGGHLDTVHDTEKIKWELWRIVYGVWNYIKNSGNFPGTETMTLEWVGNISGKRESRRFEGDVILIQQDIVEQRAHYDAVSFGGWAIDLHPADGIYSNKPGCEQWHAKGVYSIPYRCMYSRNINNLFLAGRILSASHVACGSTRVMMTCAHNAQAVGMAAFLCRRNQLLPRDLSTQEQVQTLQQELLKIGQYIPGLRLSDPNDLVHEAQLEASTTFQGGHLPADGTPLALSEDWAMMIPVGPGPMPSVTLTVTCSAPSELVYDLRVSDKPGNFTPEVTLAAATRRLEPVESLSASAVSAPAEQSLPSPDQSLTLNFDVMIPAACYVFLRLKANPHVAVLCSRLRPTGLKAVTSKANPRVAKDLVQKPDRDIGIDTMEFWLPPRWPAGENFAMTLEPALACFGPENVRNGINRPVSAPNAWVADPSDPQPTLTLTWDRPRSLRRIELTFDTDADHPMESVLMGHPHHIIPTCVRRYRLLDALGRVIHACDDNHQTRNVIRLDNPVTTDVLVLELHAPDRHIPAALFEVRCYE